MSARGDVEFGTPRALNQLRVVDRNALFVDLTIDYEGTTELVTATRLGASETWSAALTVPSGTPFSLTVSWYDVADQQRLDLVTSTRDFPAFDGPGEASITFDFDDFESDAFDADADAVTNLQERLDETDPFDAASPGTDPGAPPLVDPGETDVVLSDCASLPITTTEPSTDVSSPLVAAPGTLHTGSLPEDVSTYYDVPLPAGRHLLIVDVHDTGGVTNSTLGIDRLDAVGEVIDVLLDELDLDKVRYRRDLELETPETVRLRFRDATGTGDVAPDVYTFGVFAEGDPVPSPFFTDCPTVIPIDVGDSASFEFEDGYENEVFLVFDAAEVRTYELALFLATVAGPEGIRARLELVDGFGEIGPEESSFRNQIRGFDTTDGTIEESVTFTNRDTGRNWLRFRTRIIATLNRRYAVQATLGLAP